MLTFADGGFSIQLGNSGIELTRHGLYLALRRPRQDRDGLGLVIKLRCEMNFRELHDGYRWAREWGPLYVRSYRRKPVRI